MFIRNILLLFIINTCCLTETSSQLALPGCEARCGDVIIPYPFGIGPNCSALDTYSITCNKSYNPPKPVLTSINLEVLDISLDGTVRVNNPIFNSCRSDSLVVDFRNTPFTYSTYATRFTAIDCNNLALISNEGGIIGGCISLCANSSSIMGAECYGVFCCQSTIPPELKLINASLNTIEKYENDRSCKYAFMVDTVWFGNFTRMFYDLIDMYFDFIDKFRVLGRTSFPAVLDWRLWGKCNTFGAPGSGINMTVCDSSAFCSDRNVCSCPQGYQGNPYIALQPLKHRISLISVPIWFLRHQ